MQRQFTSGSRQAPDPCDQFLEENNFYRKHTARDASCLFRVISEQMYDSQLHHLDIRKQCVEYMRKYHKFFQPLVDRDLEDYLDDLSKPKTFGTLTELQALGYMYRRNVVLFEPFDLGNYFVHSCNYENVFRVFYSHERHFDSVFTCDYIKTAAICQGICYDILYMDLFKLPDVAFAVEQMLHSSSLENVNYHTEFDDHGFCMRLVFANGQNFQLDLPQNTNCILEDNKMCNFHSHKNTNTATGDNDLNEDPESMLRHKFISCVRQLLMEGITPFPYKVAKALDPNMYRNIEFDAWNEARKEIKFQNWYNGDSNFKVGAKCHVKLGNSENDVHTCHIQEIASDKGYCIVFIEELGVKRMVSYDALSPLPLDQFKPWTLPYRFQRQMQKYSMNFASRHCNYAFKFNEHCTADEYFTPMRNSKSNINAKHYTAVALNAATMTARQKDCFYNLKQYTQLENFQTQTVQYCTMPLTVEMKRNQGIVGNIETIPRPPSAPSTIGSENMPHNNGPPIVDHNSAVLDSTELVPIESYEGPEQENPVYLPDIQYFYPMPSEDFYGYNNMQSTATLFPSNNGGTIYYFNNGAAPYLPSPNNTYIQPSAAFQPHPLITSAISSNVQNNCLVPNNTYSNISATRPLLTNNSASPQTTMTVPARLDNRTMNSNGNINLNAKKSSKTNGSDLPTDVATLRHFYNLGVDYHQRYMRHSTEENKENTSSANTGESKIDETTNPREAKSDSNNNSVSNASSNTNNNPNCQNCNNASASQPTNNKNYNSNRRFGFRHANNKDRSIQRTITNNVSSKPNSSFQHRNDFEKNATNNRSGLVQKTQAQSNSNYALHNQMQVTQPPTSGNAGAANTVTPYYPEQGVPNSSLINYEGSYMANNIIQNQSYNYHRNPPSVYNSLDYNADVNISANHVGPPVAAPSSGMFIQVAPIGPPAYNPYAPHLSPAVVHPSTAFHHPNYMGPPSGPLLTQNSGLELNENIPIHDSNMLYPCYGYPQTIYYAPTTNSGAGTPQVGGINNSIMQSVTHHPPPPQQ